MATHRKKTTREANLKGQVSFSREGRLKTKGESKKREEFLW